MATIDDAKTKALEALQGILDGGIQEYSKGDLTVRKLTPEALGQAYELLDSLSVPTSGQSRNTHGQMVDP